jgi:MFS transporter, MFS domain-containing protein family, molybdate-anion transporter
MLGRLLGGVSTSLLFSIFEAWLIRAHADAQVKSFIGKSFSWAAYGNSISAITAGLLANKAASSIPMVPLNSEFFYIGGYLMPFDIALVALVVCAFLAQTTWEENYGEAPSGSNSGSGGEDDSEVKEGKWYDGLKNAFTTTIRSQDILLCGIISSLYEGSMYIFGK